MTAITLLPYLAATAQPELLDVARQGGMPFGSGILLYAVGGVIGILLLLLIVFMLVRRALSGRITDMELGMTLPDISKLKQKGLLTEEESLRLRESIARRTMERAMNPPTPAKTGGASSLLVDPEVRRLEALAMVKMMESPPSAMEPRDSPAEDMARRKAAEKKTFHEPAAHLSVGHEAQAAMPHGEDAEPELPPDIQSMAEMGLITEEELQQMKKRLRGQKSP
ncbi:MAG: hypothetical protein WCK47_06665 [bacterium]